MKGPQPAKPCWSVPTLRYTGIDGFHLSHHQLRSKAAPLQPNGVQVISPRQHKLNVIVAPIVSIHDATPDYKTSTDIGVTSGRYAFWVGDEGVKAKYTPSDPYVFPEHARPIAGRRRTQLSRYRFWAPLRTALGSGCPAFHLLLRANSMAAPAPRAISRSRLQTKTACWILRKSTLWTPQYGGHRAPPTPAQNITNPEQTLGAKLF